MTMSPGCPWRCAGPAPCRCARQLLDAVVQLAADPSLHAVVPGTLDQHPTRERVAGLGDPAAADRAAARAFARHQAEIGHELARLGEATEVADLGGDGHGHDLADATHGLERSNDRRQRPARQQVRDLLGQSGHPPLRVLDGVDIVLQHDLLGWMREAQRRQPPSIGQGPGGPAGIDPAMPQQEALQMLARLAEHPHGRGSGTDEVAHRLMRRVRHPHRGELAGPVQLRQAQRVTPVGLHPVARLARDQGRRHHHAGVTKPLELPLQAVAARAGLIAEAQLPPISGQPSRQLGDDLGPVREDPKLPDLATPHTLGNRHHDRRLVDVHADKHDAAHQARSPCRRLGAGQPGATRDGCMPWSGPPVSAREHRV